MSAKRTYGEGRAVTPTSTAPTLAKTESDLTQTQSPLQLLFFVSEGQPLQGMSHGDALALVMAGADIADAHAADAVTTGETMSAIVSRMLTTSLIEVDRVRNMMKVYYI